MRDLGVSHILVLGHAQCGGIQAACKHAEGADLSSRDFLESWVGLAQIAIQDELSKNEPETLARRAEQASIKQSVKNLQSFPWIADKLAAGTVSIDGWWFDLSAGALWALDSDHADFQQISGA